MLHVKNGTKAVGYFEVRGGPRLTISPARAVLGVEESKVVEVRWQSAQESVLEDWIEFCCKGGQVIVVPVTGACEDVRAHFASEGTAFRAEGNQVYSYDLVLHNDSHKEAEILV